MATVIIFGLDVTGVITLSVLGPSSDDFPPMSVKSGGTLVDVPYDKQAGRWGTDLKAGAYLVRIEEKDAPVVGAAVAFIGRPYANSAATFVSFGPEDASGARTTVAWGANAAGSDPKDPWPPPATAAGVAASFDKTLRDQAYVSARTRDS